MHPFPSQKPRKMLASWLIRPQDQTNYNKSLKRGITLETTVVSKYVYEEKYIQKITGTSFEFHV